MRKSWRRLRWRAGKPVTNGAKSGRINEKFKKSAPERVEDAAPRRAAPQNHRLQQGAMEAESGRATTEKVRISDKRWLILSRKTRAMAGIVSMIEGKGPPRFWSGFGGLQAVGLMGARTAVAGARTAPDENTKSSKSWAVWQPALGEASQRFRARSVW